MADLVGQQLGNYRLLRVLGQGAFAAVYLGEHQYLERLAAIKVLHMQMEASRHEAFRREARTIAQLHHPHIIAVHDFGVSSQTPYLVMEYMQGGTLRSRQSKGTSLPFEQIVSYVKQIASALDYAHKQHVIHRDIKPENILLNTKAEVVLSDFGIAVIQPTLDSLSMQGPAGTPLYMAPEQIQGKPCAASDQYALGVMVYEWLCGEPPFRGSLYEVFHQHLHKPPPSLCARLPELPLAVEDAVMSTLTKDPQQRFVSAADFARVLEEAFFATQPLGLRGSVEHEPQSHIVLPPAFVSAPVESEQEPSDEATQPQLKTVHRINHEHELVENVFPQPAIQSQITLRQTRPTLTQIIRQRLLRRVRSFWIAGVLEQSLHGAALLALGLEKQPEAVANPWHLVLQYPDMAPRSLPAGTHITQVYDDADGELLILGAPGSGKTTLLLELARDLLERAEHNEQHPIPVIFNLSSWAMKQRPLVDWLVEELVNKYQVPRRFGQTLVDADQILPLLDGLDEVAPKSRTVCIETINTYRQEHGLSSLVICSRSADYLEQTTRVLLGSAVAVQPLTQQQVNEYLTSGGESLWALRVALHRDAALCELSSTPLMLSILTLTYHGKPVEDLLRGTSLSDRQRYVFKHYVERMLTRRGTDRRYTHQQATHWLSWLAKRLSQQGQTVFYIERMQPNWLPGNGMRQRFSGYVAGVLFGLIAALAFGLVGRTYLHPSFIFISQFWWHWGPLLFGSFFGLMVGGLVGLLNGLLSMRYMKKRSAMRQSWRQIWHSRMLGALLNGLLVGLLMGLSAGLISEQRGGNGFGEGLGAGAFGAFWGSVGFGLIDALFDKKMREIQPAEIFVWSWIHAGRNTIKFLFTGMAGVFLIPLLTKVLNSLYEWAIGRVDNILNSWQLLDWFLSTWESELRFMSFLVPLAGLLGVLTGGLSGHTIDEHNLTTPNQGIHRSARRSALVALGGGLLGGLLIGGAFGGFVYWTSIEDVLWKVMLPFGSMAALFVGLISGLWAGGIACIQHLVLRLLLWRAGFIPRNYPQFLDYAAERILLRKVGGGYIFIHRLLLEYFASLDTTPTPEHKSSRHDQED